MSSTPVTTRRFSLPLFLRSLTGLVLAPIVGGAICLGALGGFSGMSDGLSEMFSGIFKLSVMGAYIGAFYGVIPALIIGWPIHLLFQRMGWTNVVVYMLVGAVLGVAAMMLAGLVMGDGIDVGGFLQ